jgi:hypothetical protein
MSLRRLTSLLTTCTAGVVVALGGAPVASAATTRSTSTNWAGYAVTKTGMAFRHVSGTWVQPAVDCTQGGGTYSSVWVGLGGYKSTSSALEQIGTEADCSASGRAVYSSWYELVPDTSRSARIKIAAGDRIHASVAVTGLRTTMTIKNLTRGTSFTKTLRASAVDVSSAEWIVEAPALCSNSGQCATSALAAFETTTFTGAQAVSRTGHAGTIGDAAWTAHAIDLATAGGRRFADSRGGGSGAGSGEATTGALDATGASFAVTYAGSGGATVSGSDPAGTGQGPWGTPRR